MLGPERLFCGIGVLARRLSHIPARGSSEVGFSLRPIFERTGMIGDVEAAMKHAA